MKDSDLERLRRMSNTLLVEERLIDLIGLHIPLTRIVARCLKFLEEFDSEAAGKGP